MPGRPLLAPEHGLGAAQGSADSITRKGPKDLIVEALRPTALATAGNRKRRSTMTRGSANSGIRRRSTPPRGVAALIQGDPEHLIKRRDAGMTCLLVEHKREWLHWQRPVLGYVDISMSAAIQPLGVTSSTGRDLDRGCGSANAHGLRYVHIILIRTHGTDSRGVSGSVLDHAAEGDLHAPGCSVEAAAERQLPACAGERAGAAGDCRCP